MRMCILYSICWVHAYGLQVTPGLAARCYDSFLLPDVMGSDHVPLGLTLLHAAP